MSGVNFADLLFRSIAVKLEVAQLPLETKRQVVQIYNSIDPNVFKGYKLSVVLPILTKHIIDELKQNYTLPTNTLPTIVRETLKNKKVASGSKHAGQPSQPDKTNRANQLNQTNQPDKTNRANQLNQTDKTRTNVANNYTDQVDLRQYLLENIATNNGTTSDELANQGRVFNMGAEPVDTVESKKILDLTISSFLGVDDISTLQLLFNPSTLYTYSYGTCLGLVSNDSTDVTTGQVKFDIADSVSHINGTNVLVTSTPLKDMIAVKIYRILLAAPINTNLNSGKVTVSLQEFEAQAYIGPSGYRYHTINTIAPDDIIIYNTTQGEFLYVTIAGEDKEDNVFKFRKPVTAIQSLTISLGNPYTPIEFSALLIHFEFLCLATDK